MPISPTGLPTPVVGDDPDVPSDMLALSTALDKTTVPQFTTTAARDAARTAGATFMMCFVGDAQYRWRLGAWTVVDPPKGKLAYNALAAQTDVTTGSLLSTSFTLTSSRWIRVVANVQFLQITANSGATNISIYINGAAQTRLFVGGATSGDTFIVSGFAYLQCPTGSNTASLSFQSAPGAMRVAPTQTFLTVEDAGP